MARLTKANERLQNEVSSLTNQQQQKDKKITQVQKELLDAQRLLKKATIENRSLSLQVTKAEKTKKHEVDKVTQEMQGVIDQLHKHEVDAARDDRILDQLEAKNKTQKQQIAQLQQDKEQHEREKVSQSDSAQMLRAALHFAHLKELAQGVVDNAERYHKQITQPE